MPDGESVILLAIRCRDCQATFFLCRHCYRGQCYCGFACRARSRLQQRRAANARHQQTEAGRLDHKDRQNLYRHRQRAGRVTDRSSPQPHSASLFNHDAPASIPASPAVLPAAGRPRIRTLPPLRCCLCGRPGITVDFWRLYGYLFWSSQLLRPVNYDTP